MKTFLTAFKTLAIVIAMLGFGNMAMAQDPRNYTINDGGTLRFLENTYNGTVTSTTGDNNSTAMFTTEGIVNLNGTYSGYYGTLNVTSGGTLTLNSSQFPAKFTLGSALYSETTTLKINYSAGSVIFNGTTNLIMDKWGVLDIVKDLRLGSGIGIVMNNNTQENAPKILFHVTGPGSTPIIELETLPTNIDPSKNLVFDMATATGTINAESNFTVAIYTGDDPVIAAATPILTNDDESWTNTSVTKLSKILKLNATFAPLFDINSTATSYAGTLAGLSVRTNTLYQKLLKNKTLADGYTVADNLLIDLQALSLIGGQTFTINSDKMLGLKVSASTGNFTNTVSFGSTTSILQLVGHLSLNQMPTIAGGGSQGILQVGDGTNTSSFNITPAVVTKFNDKVSTVIVKGGATVIVGNPD
ncbi:MAG: hypothetical protein WCP85_30985 [Mariniphaga sp.]